MFMRYSSLAALAAAVFGPIYFVFLFGFQPMSIALLVVCLLLIWRHRSNIKNLMNGAETPIGSKKKAKAGADKQVKTQGQS
jgi:glycerol-3-phosphate acyltransferase PlsY